MTNHIGKIAGFLWPAYEVLSIDRLIRSSVLSDAHLMNLEKEEKELSVEIRSKSEADLEAICDYGRQIYDSEATRRNTIEGKAATIAQSAGVVTAFASVVPAFSGRQWTTSTADTKIVLTIMLGLAVLHLAMALRMAFAARSVGEVYLPNTHEFADLIAEKPANFRAEVVMLDLARTKRNEGIIGMKCNRLNAAESYYKRGLLFLAAFILLALFCG